MIRVDHLPVKWINRLSKYWSEGVGSRIECAQMECQKRERLTLKLWQPPGWEFPVREQGVRDIER